MPPLLFMLQIGSIALLFAALRLPAPIALKVRSEVARESRRGSAERRR